jgi:predicted transcriptional regulator of viral defense system
VGHRGNVSVFYRKGDQNCQMGTRFLVRHKIVSADKRVEFVTDRMSYAVLRGRWIVIVLNSHAPTEKKVMV